MNSTITTKKNEHEKYFTPNSGKWLEKQNCNLENIYNALTNKKFDKSKLNDNEKYIIDNNVLRQNSKANSDGIRTFYKPINVEKVVKESIPVKEKTKEPKLVPVKQEENEKINQFNLIKDSIKKYSEKYGIDQRIIPIIIVTEHSGDNDINRVKLVAKKISTEKGIKKIMQTEGKYAITSYGFGQFTKPTLEGLLEKGDTFEKVINSPDLSIKYMGKFINKLIKEYDCKNVEEIAFAYNAGPSTLRRLKKKYGENNWKEGAQKEIDANTKINGLNKKGTLYVGLNYVKKAQEAYKQISSF